MNKKRILCLCLIGLNLALIWGSSSMNGEQSAAFSGWVGSLIDWLFPGADASGGGAGHGVLRKVAHFTEFCTLGMLFSWLARMTCKERWLKRLSPLASGVLVACVDETIQLFVPGRAGLLTDVGIDTLGCTLGIVLITLFFYVRRKFLEETNL